MDKDQILHWKDELVLRYGDRDNTYQNNYWAFMGEYDKITGYDMRADSLSGKDVRNRKDNSWQVWNLMRPIVMTAVMQLARLPEIQVPAPIKGDPIAAAFADKQEKAYYALWGMNDMAMKHARMAFYLACYGSAVTWVRPDEERGIPTILERKPGTCYPMVRGEGTRDFRFVIFRWLEDMNAVSAEFPATVGAVKPKPGRANQVEVVEYIDEDTYTCIVEDKVVRQVHHGYGFVPVTITPAVDTGEIFGPSDIDQLVSVNVYLNALMTKLSDAIEENLYPTGFVIGADWQPLNTGPGSWNFMPEGTQVHRMEPARIPPELFSQVERTEQFVRTHAQWPRVMSGDMEGSIITGRAVSKLQGTTAGLASIRQLYMAADLQRINSYMMRIMEKEWPSKKFNLRSEEPVTLLSGPKTQTGFAVDFVPKEDIQGYYANQLLYSIFTSDFNGSIVSALQLQDSGVTSKRFTRNQLPGLRDAEGMRLEVKEEKREDMEFEIELQQRLKDIETQAAQAQTPPATMPPGAEGEAPAGMPPGPPQGAESPPPQGAAGPGGLTLLPGGQPSVMGMGEPLGGKENFPLPFDQVKPYSAAIDKLMPEQGQGPPQEERPPSAISLDEVVAAVGAVEKLKGQVFAVGKLASTGYTEGNIELAITNPIDKGTLVNALQQWYGKLRFMVVKSQPKGSVPCVPELAQEMPQPEPAVA